MRFRPQKSRSNRIWLWVKTRWGYLFQDGYHPTAVYFEGFSGVHQGIRGFDLFWKLYAGGYLFAFTVDIRSHSKPTESLQASSTLRSQVSTSKNSKAAVTEEEERDDSCSSLAGRR